MNRVLQFGIAALALSQVVANAGVGSVLVQNNNGGTIVPIFNTDGTTILKGTDFKVGVYVYGGTSTTDSQGHVIPSLGAQVGGFLSPAASNGRFASTGATDVPGSLAGGTSQLVVIAWDTKSGADFASAQTIGYSSVFTSPALGGDVDNDPNTPGAVATSMALNFKSFSLYTVPEPSTVALAALGLGGLLFISRRK